MTEPNIFFSSCWRAAEGLSVAGDTFYTKIKLDWQGLNSAGLLSAGFNFNEWLHRMITWQQERPRRRERGKREGDRKERRVQVFWKNNRKSVIVVKANQNLTHRNSKSIHCTCLSSVTSEHTHDFIIPRFAVSCTSWQRHHLTWINRSKKSAWKYWLNGEPANKYVLINTVYILLTLYS